MPRHRKETPARDYVNIVEQPDKTVNIKELQQVAKDVKLIDDSIKRWPIPEPTVKP